MATAARVLMLLLLADRSENTVLLLKGGTIMCVFRQDGGDGVPDHRHVPYMFALSSDVGHSWALREAPKALLSARPRGVSLPSGPLVLAVRAGSLR